MSPEGRSAFWETYRAPTSDPRTIVTHAAFSVHPDLLGIPLAQHSRRVTAMLVDLLLIALITQAGGLLLGVLAVVFLFRVTFRRKSAGAPSLMGTAFRGVVGCFGAVVLLVTVIVLWSAVSSRTGGRSSPDRAAVEAPEGVRTVGARGVLSALGGMGEVRRFRQAETEEEALRWARALVVRGEELELSPEEVGEILREFAPDDAPWRSAMVDWDLAPGTDPAPESDDAFAPAVAQEPAPEQFGPPALEIPPELADTLALLEGRLDAETRRRLEAERAVEDLRNELREARREARRFAGIRAFLRRVADDLGLGFGWGALYFTVFTTWWGGRTPGKRLMRLRVVRLSGEPLNWWDSFERFGGYTAGFATGLLGFVQVYWDPNRQAIHDRIGRTVVIQDGKPPVAGNWHVEAGPAARPRPRAGFPPKAHPPSGPAHPEESK